MSDTIAKQIRLERRPATYWRVTIDKPPLNIYGPGTAPHLERVVSAMESDPALTVVPSPSG